MGLTQTELARRSGVPQPNIAAYESGRRSPSPATSMRLDRALRPSSREALAAHRDEVVAILARHHMRSPRVFGSVAGGRDTLDSDVDLLVDADPDLDVLDIIDAGDLLRELLGVEVDIVTSRSLRAGHEIERTAVPV